MGNLINGTSGSDVLTGMHGDTLVGGAGQDVYNVQEGTVTIVLSAGDGSDVVEHLADTALREAGCGLAGI